MTRKRTVLAIALLAFASLALTGAAIAAGGKKHHQAVKHEKVVQRRARRKTFAPTTIVKAAEVSAVQLDPLTQQFVQVTFDRGRVTADSSSSITLQQKQDNAVWRTQTFTVPSTAIVTLNGHASTLTQIPTGAQARVESSGTPGSTLTVVRVNAYLHGVAPLPAVSNS